MKPELCPKCKGEIIGVEYSLIDPFYHDGTSEWSCINSFKHGDELATCDWRMGRFCGTNLSPHEVEPPYCKGKQHPSVG